MKNNFYIGTSGWHYKHWAGTFYPAHVKSSGQFKYYLTFFSTVEINNSFYRLPTRKTFLSWKNSTPKHFIFSVKASRYITHMKKLKESKSSLHEFMDHALVLKEKLGPVLFQLPPGWKINTERLDLFLQSLPSWGKYVFEFRNPTWYHPDVFALLKKYNCAFCIYELDGHLTPIELTANFVYIRLHGPGGKYQGNYPDATLKQWSRRCKNWLKTKDVFIYFDNDEAGYAAFNAIRLQELVIGKNI
jgi:uncharacterized protein YecE (DUF72 family)